MVSVLAIYSDDPSLNTARVCSFYSVKLFFFFKMGLSRSLFVYFRHFLITILIIEKA